MASDDVGIALSSKEWDAVVQTYLRQRCYSVTVEMMEERIAAGESIQTMLLDPIRNDAVNHVLKQVINEGKQKR